jgi:U32 family peptidase
MPQLVKERPMKSELLLPVGNMSMCLAAIHHGADAVYIGVPFFNARGRTTDFGLDELKEMIDLCHLYGVRVNLAFNVVIFQHEFPKVIELLKEILPMGPDAFIVQDLGLARLIREMAPDQRIHASTQMTVTNPDAIQFVDDLRIDRFVLGRENSLPEIQLIREQTDKELEVFVHGALCVAYSGQCFTSESLGGRSANRGQCAQSCRLEYELYVDDVKKEMGDKKYLVSPKDLMGLAEVPKLKELGVNSFKIEGRLKTPEYVASTARNYRDVLDGKPLHLESRVAELSATYSRGFFSGWLNGVDHQQLVDGTFSAHRGLEIGTIKEVKKKTFLMDSLTDLKAGMGLLFVSDKEMGSKIFSVVKSGKVLEVELVQKSMPLKKGMKVYLNSNEILDRELQKGWQSREHQKKIPLDFLVEGKLGSHLQVSVRDPEGREVREKSHSLLVSAASHSLDIKQIKEELSSLGGTPYQLKNIKALIEEGLFLNHKELKELRRSLVEKINLLRLERTNTVLPFAIPAPKATPRGTAGLNILLRSKSQVEGFSDAFKNGAFGGYEQHIKSVVCDFEFGKDYASSIAMIQALNISAGIATTRILKPKEYHNLKMIARCKPDFILARNLGAVEFLRRETDIALLGDFSLNVTNSLTSEYLLEKGLESVNVSYDLNQAQLLDLVAHSDASRLEVTLHQYMPEFHMEHCVFAGFLSSGHSFRDCGKPCEKHEVKLKDPYGNWHHLKADHECRNTFFKATPQSASFLAQQLIENGVQSFRLEALNETSVEINHKILTYLKLLKGDITSQDAVTALQLVESYGLGVGQLHKSDNYKDRKKEVHS